MFVSRNRRSRQLRMRLRFGFLVLSVTIYTAKSFSIGQSGENVDRVPQAQASEANETAAQLVPRTDLYLTQPPPRIASFFKKFNLLPTRNSDESSENDENNEIAHGDVIEIEVPVIGSDFSTFRKYQLETNEVAKGHSDSTLTTTRSSAPDISQTETVTDGALTFSPDFQTAANDDATTLKNAFDTTTQPVEDETEAYREHISDDIRNAESKLMEQWKAVEDELIDGSFESKIFTLQTQRRSKYPFNVKIIVNNEDERKSCKSKASCSQVSFSRSRDYGVDQQFYSEYSDEDLLFKSEPERYLDRPNGLRARNARRAADDMPITPAPRFPPIRGMKRPSFLEQLESESSLERSERINKNLDGLLRFVSVWAQVDKFVSDRARGAVKKLAYLSGDDYIDDFTLGSKRRVDTKRTAVDEPFT